jgi:putative ATP-binding cassette transporter
MLRLRKIFNDCRNGVKTLLSGRQRRNLLQDTCLSTAPDPTKLMVANLRSPMGLITSYFTKSNEKLSAWARFGVITALAVAQTYCSGEVLNRSKDIFDALGTSHYDQLPQLGGITALWMLAGGLSIWLRHRESQTLRLGMRTWNTEQFAEGALATEALLHVRNLPGEVGNVPQLIQDDIDRYGGSILGLGLSAEQTLINLGYFTWMLYDITKQSAVHLGNLYMPGPPFWIGFLLSGVVAGSITLASAISGKPLKKMNKIKMNFEGAFRETLTNIYANIGQIVANGGQARELKRLKDSFHPLQRITLKMRDVEARMQFVNNLCINTSNVVSNCIGGVMWAINKMSYGQIMQYTNIFNTLRDNFSFVQQSWSAISEVGANIERLNIFAERIMETHDPAKYYESKGLKAKVELVHEQGRTAIEARGLTLIDSDHRMNILSDQDFTIESGARIFIAKDDDHVGSRLIQSVCGVFPFGEGKILVPEDRTIMSVSSDPALMDGTLNDIIAWPGQLPEDESSRIYDALRMTKIADKYASDINRRAHGQTAWNDLPVEEKRLIAFARVFLAKPDFVFLDDATTGMDPEKQKFLYAQLKKHCPETTIVTVAPKDSPIRAEHDIDYEVKDGKLVSTKPEDEPPNVIPMYPYGLLRQLPDRGLSF